MTPQCASSKRKACFPVLSKSYCLGCSRKNSSWPSLGQLLWRFGRDPNSSVIRRDSEWPTERERLGYVCNPRSLKEGTETLLPIATVAVPPLSCWVTGSAPQWKHELMRCTCCLLYSRCDQRQLDAMIAYQCPLAHLVTLEVDWSLWRDPQFVGHPTWRLRSLLQGTRVTYVTETFFPLFWEFIKKLLWTFLLLLERKLYFSATSSPVYQTTYDDFHFWEPWKHKILPNNRYLLISSIFTFRLYLPPSNDNLRLIFKNTYNLNNLK